MKNKLVFVFIITITLYANAQIYTPSGTIQGTSGNNFTGIGTNQPSQKLEVYGNHGDSRILLHSFGNGGIAQADLLLWASEPGLSYTGTGIGNNIFNSSSGNGGIRLLNTTRGGSYLRLLDNYLSLNVVSSSGVDNQALNINSVGNIGIGTSTPTAKLQVNNGDNSYGTILATSSESAFSLYAKSLSTAPIYAETFRLGLKYDNTETNGFISFYRGENSNGGFLGFSTNGNERIRITNNGNIGIGIANPLNKLDVKGTIHSQEVKVDMLGWSDFVFKKEYTLPTLEEVEKHITEKGHLENIPSEEEVLKNGISLGEMNAKLLQKIEELTLYMIEMKKENVELKKRIEIIEKK